MRVRYASIVLLLLMSMGISPAGAHPSKQVTTLKDPLTQLLHAQAWVEFVNGVNAGNAVDIVNLVKADQEAFLATLYTPPPPPPPTVQPVPAPTIHNNGAHSDAWWHGVSICEQGGRNDSYFGYFSIMDGSAGGLDWSTQVAMANAIIARAGDGAWAQSCQNAGYAASPSG